jgi:hypothetical protein
MRDVRKRQKAERQFYRGQELRVCKVCGRWFRAKGSKDVVCSTACKARLDGRQRTEGR